MKQTPLLALALLALAPAAHAQQYAITDLGTFGGTFSLGLSVNNSGQATGYSGTPRNAAYHAFVYSNGVLKDIGTLGGSSSLGFSINNSGQVTGFADTANGTTHAFVYSNGTLTDIGTFGGSNSEGLSINNSGQVTGDATTDGDAASHAFLYSSSTGLVDLNNLISPTSGWQQLTSAYDISDNGFITGSGIINGQTHAFLLTPLAAAPEPSSVAAFAIGLLGLGALAIKAKRRTA